MNDGRRIPLRHVPRTHAAWLAAGSEIEHATAPNGLSGLCGIPDGEIHRHLFEDIPRTRTCPSCQALADSIRASDLLGAVSGAVGRGDMHLSQEQRECVAAAESALLSTYPPDESRPDFDVRHP